MRQVEVNFEASNERRQKPDAHQPDQKEVSVTECPRTGRWRVNGCVHTTFLTVAMHAGIGKQQLRVWLSGELSCSRNDCHHTGWQRRSETQRE